MGILRAEKRELERMLSRVCLLALWEVAATDGITDEQAYGAVVKLMDWLMPIHEHFVALETDKQK